MTPQKKEEIEKSKIDSLGLEANFDNKRIISVRELRNQGWKLEEQREKNLQRRTNLYHYVIHLLAVFMVVSYILFTAWEYEIPKEFTTVISVIVGFYFAKSIKFISD